MLINFVYIIIIVAFISCEDEVNQCGCSLIALNPQNQEIMLKNFNNLIPVNNMTKIDYLNKCEMDCRIQASIYFDENKLENLENFYDMNTILNVSNKICILLNSDKNQPNLNIFLKIQNLSNEESFSKLINLGTICCNRPCSCVLKSKYSVVKDFASELINQKNKAYACSEEINLCEQECRNLVGNYYTHEQIKDPSKDLDNIFENRTDLGESACVREAKSVYKPGIEYFISAQTVIESQKNIYLGKVCCNRPCDCKIYKSEFNRTEALIDINSLMPTRNLFYNCDNEQSECYKDCRDAAAKFFDSEDIKDLSKPVSSLGLFSKFYLAAKICSLLKRDIEEPGVEVFLRYSTFANTNNKIKEDLKIGRLCCQNYFNTFLPSDRCNQAGLPSG